MKTFPHILIILAITSCMKEMPGEEKSQLADGRTIEVSMPQMTKTAIGESTEAGVSVVWSKGDEIAVIENKGTTQQKHSVYRLIGEGGSSSGTFEYVSGNAVGEVITDIVFPASAANNGYAVPTEQKYVENSFDPSAMVMSWSGTDKEKAITLEHEASAFMLTITGTANQKVSAIEVEAEEETYTLNFSKAVSLSTSGKVFYIAVPGSQQVSNYNITINTTTGIPMSKSVTCALNKGKIGRLPSIAFTPLKVGDIYDEGLIFEITDEYAKVVSLDEENLAWGNTNDRIGTTANPDEGIDNTDIFRARKDLSQNFPAAAWCISHGAEWYMPSRRELNTMITNLGLNSTEGVNAVNATLSAAAGTGFLDNTKRYWSCCEHATDNTKAFPIRLSDKNATAYSKTGERPVRAIKKVSFSKYDVNLDTEIIEPDFGTDVKKLPEAGEKRKYQTSLNNKEYYPVAAKYKENKGDFWMETTARIVPYLVGFDNWEMTRAEYASSTNKYGSSTTLPRQEVTGRFYVKKIGDRFWLVDPEGYIHHHRGVAGLRPSKDGDGKDNGAFLNKYGNRAGWLTEVQDELASIGFHSSGAFSTVYDDILKHNEENPDRPIMLCPSFGFLNQFRLKYGLEYCNDNSSTAICFVLHEDWEKFCEEYVSKGDVAKFLDNPTVLGIFSDNEINFSSNSEKLLDRVIGSKNEEHYAYIAAKKFMEDNLATTVTDELNQKWVGILAEKYYKGIKVALNKYDPGMLYLGSRLHGTPKTYECLYKAADKWCDVISINYYSTWSVQPWYHTQKWADWAPNTPVLISEFYTKAEDSELSNNGGAGYFVPTQQDRAFAYQHFTLGLLEAKNCIGWHWFKYQDDDPDEYENPVNKGLYDRYYNLYPWMAEYTKNLNYNVYRLIEYFDN